MAKEKVWCIIDQRRYCRPRKYYQCEKCALLEDQFLKKLFAQKDVKEKIEFYHIGKRDPRS